MTNVSKYVANFEVKLHRCPLEIECKFLKIMDKLNLTNIYTLHIKFDGGNMMNLTNA